MFVCNIGYLRTYADDRKEDKSRDWWVKVCTNWHTLADMVMA